MAMLAFELTVEDVRAVLLSKPWLRMKEGGAVTEEKLEELFDSLDVCAVERAALRGVDLDDQTTFAHVEIATQLIEQGFVVEGPSPVFEAAAQAWLSKCSPAERKRREVLIADFAKAGLTEHPALLAVMQVKPGQYAEEVRLNQEAQAVVDAAKRKLSEMMEVRKVLVLSTGHLTQDTCQNFKAWPYIAGFDGGCYVYVGDEPEMYVDAPADLQRVLLFAKQQGCAEVKFDKDGLCLEGVLPWYDWE